MSAKVDNLINSSSLESGFSSSTTETHENLLELRERDVLTPEYIDISEPRNVSSNTWGAPTCVTREEDVLEWVHFVRERRN